MVLGCLFKARHSSGFWETPGCFCPRRDACILTREMETKQVNIQLRSFQVMPNTVKEMKYLGCTGKGVSCWSVMDSMGEGGVGKGLPKELVFVQRLEWQ